MQAYGEDVGNGEAPRHYVHLSWNEGEERAVRGFLEQDQSSIWLRISEKVCLSLPALRFNVLATLTGADVGGWIPSNERFGL